MYYKLSSLLPRYSARVEVTDWFGPRHPSFDDTQPLPTRLVSVGDRAFSNARADCEVPHLSRNTGLNYSWQISNSNFRFQNLGLNSGVPMLSKLSQPIQ